MGKKTGSETIFCTLKNKTETYSIIHAVTIMCRSAVADAEWMSLTGGGLGG